MGVAADERAVLNHRLMLFLPIVVARDGSRPDVHVGADGRIAEVGQVVRLGAGPHRRFLQFDEITDLGAFADIRVGPQMGKRADRRPIGNPRTNDEAKIVNRNPFGQYRVADPDVAVNLTGRADFCLPLENHARVNHGVRSDLDVFLDIRRRRIDDGDAGRHQLFVLRLSHDRAYFRELRPAVDAPDLLRILQYQCFHRQLAPPIDRHEVGQVVLPLRVLRRDGAERVEQRGQVKCVDAAVDFLDGALGRRRVALLDNPRDLSACPHDAPVAIRPFDDRRDDGLGGRGGCVGVDKLPKGLRAQQWHVARKQEERACTALERRLSLLQRMCGPELRRLHHELQVLVGRQPGAHGVSFMADNERNRLRAEGPRGPKDVLDHGPPGNRMQDLRESGLHSSPLTRGKDHDMRV